MQAVHAVSAWAQHDAGQSLDQTAFKRLLEPLVALLGRTGPEESLPSSLQDAVVHLATAGSGDAFAKPLHHAVRVWCCHC